MALSTPAQNPLGKDIILIGHKGHPEVVGTMGQLADGEVMLVETLKEAKTVSPDNPDKLAYITQTTLSVDDTQQILQVLGDRFPSLEGPPKEDICYATTNRQAAVQNIASKCDVMLVVGAPNSSNSKRLVEVAQRSGCHNSVLVQRADDICWEMLQSSRTVGITAGASAPEVLVDEIIDALSKRYDVTIEALETVRENVAFKLPKAVC
jgi:4-hydroxy-3-methylbut-2-enyl diphosphate reductase